MDTEETQDAFLTIKRLYESLLNVAIKAPSSTGESSAINTSADPASDSPSLLTETPSADPASSSLLSPESDTLPPASSSLASHPVFTFSESSPLPSSSLVSSLPPASTLSSYSKLSTELGSPGPVSSSGKERKRKRKADNKGSCGGVGAVASLLWMWEKVEKLLGAKRKYSKFIMKKSLDVFSTSVSR
ncbi:unnamed protein product [Leuciscus chuanchicus]